MLLALLALALPAQAAPARPNCTAPQFRQLDFWVGAWNVNAPPDKTIVGTSRIEKTVNGCAISEAFEAPRAPGGAYAGKSYSSYDRKDGKWHQFYVDVTGGAAWFTGSLVGADMVLFAPGKDNSIQKMVYSPQAGGAVRQTGTVSTDGGKTWQPAYDYLYQKK